MGILFDYKCNGEIKLLSLTSRSNASFHLLTMLEKVHSPLLMQIPDGPGENSELTIPTKINTTKTVAKFIEKKTFNSIDKKHPFFY